MLDELINVMKEINYGVPNEKNENLLEKIDEDEVFSNYYHLQSPEELLKSKLGVCWDQVELERSIAKKYKQQIKTFFICTYDKDNIPSHTFLTYEENNKFYWFENSWDEYRGLHKYSTLKGLLRDVKMKFIKSNKTNENAFTFIYEYEKPKQHLSCSEMYKYMETQKLVKINEPLYFYHVVNKNANLEKGLLSIKYMYDNKLYNLFDYHTKKYRKRIVESWGLKKYQGKNEFDLTSKDIIDALNTFRGPNGSSYIYFFKYPPYKELGSKMKALLEIKDIYRININDEEVQKNIKDMFYGYEKSNSDNPKLSRAYYENVSEKDYFSLYDDDLEMNFSMLNHISIAFKDDYCPANFLEKYD